MLVTDLRKFIYLFLALLFPTLIFIFLKYEGRNEFNIPVFYENGVEAGEGCGYNYGKPYVVSDSVLKNRDERLRQARVLVFRDETFSPSGILDELHPEFSADEVIFMDVRTIEPDSTRYYVLKNCVLLSSKPNEMVLIDIKGRIRGYYELESRKERDRLRVELKILLQAAHGN
ncbi:MAG: hypothetical protein JST46_10155 [Bacteroidetes bacterium]|nr:hypothetical protein [Bacteroidota bacterium]